MIAQTFDAFPAFVDDVPAWDYQYVDSFVDITAPPPPSRPRFDSSVTEASSYSSASFYDPAHSAAALGATTTSDILLFEVGHFLSSEYSSTDRHPRQNMFTNSNFGAIDATDSLFDPRADPGISSSGDATADWLSALLLPSDSAASSVPVMENPFLVEAAAPLPYPVQPPPPTMTIVPSSFFVPDNVRISLSFLLCLYTDIDPQMTSPASTVSSLSVATPDSIRVSSSLPTVTIDFPALETTTYTNVTIKHSSYAYPVVSSTQNATAATGSGIKTVDGSGVIYKCEICRVGKSSL